MRQTGLQHMKKKTNNYKSFPKIRDNPIQIRISYNFKEIVNSQITKILSCLGIKTLEKCHILKKKKKKACYRGSKK
jgi:hypothetical protein